MSGATLAKLPNCGSFYFCGIKRTLRNPSLENLVKLANALGVTLAEMLAGK